MSTNNLTDNEKFWIVVTMIYGGLTLCAVGIEGVAFYAGIGLAIAIHGTILGCRGV